MVTVLHGVTILGKRGDGSEVLRTNCRAGILPAETKNDGGQDGRPTKPQQSDWISGEGDHEAVYDSCRHPMNQTPAGTSRYVWGGVAVLCLFIVLGWFAFHEERSPLDQQPVKVEATKLQARHVATAFEPADDLSSETPTNQPDDPASTNAAVIYRQAFDLFDHLSKDQKYILGDWRTNVDASVEAELCEKLRPICDLMHQASAVTNCDWGIDPITFDTPLPHLNAARNIARVAIWNAAHCRSNDVARATDDAVSALQLGHQVSRSALVGCFVGMAVQNIASSYVAQKVRSFSGADGQRLAAVFDDPAYEEAPSRAMEQEAAIVERLAASLASLPADEAMKQFFALGGATSEAPPGLNRATALATLKQVADSERELARALASSSEDEYEAWLRHWTELQESSPLAEGFLANYDWFVDKMHRSEIEWKMIVAGLAVAENGPEALAAHPDPASGKPFVYTETADGFELQSSYQVNDKPMKMQ